MTRATRAGLTELAWRYGYHCWPLFQRQPDRGFLLQLREEGDPRQPREFELKGRLSARTLEEWEAAIRLRAERQTEKFCVECAGERLTRFRPVLGRPFLLLDGKRVRGCIPASVTGTCSICGEAVMGFYEVVDE